MPLPPLFKYLDVRGAKLTLGNRTFRHAKPSDFNDTEELTIQSIFPEETEAALTSLKDQFTEVVLKHLDEAPTCSSSLKEKMARLQHVFRTSPAAADVMKTEIAKMAVDGIYNVHDIRARNEAFIKEINEFMQGYRVLCVTTHKDSERMWREYAEDHKGIALRIESNVAKDSKFQLFRPVVYRERRPPLYESASEFIISGLFADQQAQRLKMLEKIVNAKTLKFEHENEYRLAIPSRQNEQPWDTLPYHPEEITELYLGTAVGDAKEEIVSMARAVNPEIAIFRAKRDPNERIVFEPY